MEQLSQNIHSIVYRHYERLVNPTPIQKTIMLLDQHHMIRANDYLDPRAVAVKADPFAIQRFEQTTELCLLAVWLKPEAIRYVNSNVEYYEEICKRAISGNA